MRRLGSLAVPTTTGPPTDSAIRQTECGEAEAGLCGKRLVQSVQLVLARRSAETALREGFVLAGTRLAGEQCWMRDCMVPRDLCLGSAAKGHCQASCNPPQRAAATKLSRSILSRRDAFQRRSPPQRLLPQRVAPGLELDLVIRAVGGRKTDRQLVSSVLRRESLNIDTEDSAMAFTRALETIQKQLWWPRGDRRRGRRLSFAFRPSPTITRTVGWRSAGRQGRTGLADSRSRGDVEIDCHADRHTEMPAR